MTFEYAFAEIPPPMHGWRREGITAVAACCCLRFAGSARQSKSRVHPSHSPCPTLHPRHHSPHGITNALTPPPVEHFDGPFVSFLCLFVADPVFSSCSQEKVALDIGDIDCSQPIESDVNIEFGSSLSSAKNNHYITPPTSPNPAFCARSAEASFHSG